MSTGGYGGNGDAADAVDSESLGSSSTHWGRTRSRSSSGDSTFQHVFTPKRPGCFDDYFELDEMLGQGSFGAIYRGRAKRPAEGCDSPTSLPWRAVKTVSSDVTQARFEAEVKVQQGLDHPNVLKLFEVFKDKIKYYLVLELCTGGELFDRIVSAGGLFDESHASSYTQQLLAAVNYLHSKSVAHRDIKAENVLFQNRDKEAPLKLIDFGCARTFTKGQAMTTSLGTPLYIAPEVLRNSYTEKCDVWSCGVIVYIMLCGEPPFSAPDEQAVLKRVVAGDYDFDDDTWEDISDDAKDAISKMMTVDSKARPSAAEMLDHSWLGSDSEKQCDLPKNLVSKLSAFKRNSQFKKIVLSLAAQRASYEDIRELQEAFIALDKNKDGTLTYDELAEGLASRNICLPAGFSETFDTIDTDASGSIDYTEFLASTMSRKLYLQEELLWSVFRTFDLDGDGKISREEFSKVVEMSSSDDEDILAMFEEFDTDGDQQIDYAELCAMMKDSGAQSPISGASPLGIYMNFKM